MSRSQMAHRFKVTYRLERQDDGSSSWIVEIPSVAGCHTYGRSLAEARRNAREALAVSLDDDDRDAIAASAVFDEEIRLPRETRAAVDRWRKTRERNAEQVARARAAEADAARAVTEQLSLRDAGELIGLSPEAVRKTLRAS